MTQTEMFSGKNLEVATDAVSLVKTQLKLMKWEPTNNEERKKHWRDLRDTYSARLIRHAGVSPAALFIIKSVIGIFGSILPSGVFEIIKDVLRQIGIEV